MVSLHGPSVFLLRTLWVLQKIDLLILLFGYFQNPNPRRNAGQKWIQLQNDHPGLSLCPNLVEIVNDFTVHSECPQIHSLSESDLLTSKLYTHTLLIHQIEEHELFLILCNNKTEIEVYTGVLS